MKYWILHHYNIKSFLSLFQVNTTLDWEIIYLSIFHTHLKQLSLSAHRNQLFRYRLVEVTHSEQVLQKKRFGFIQPSSVYSASHCVLRHSFLPIMQENPSDHSSCLPLFSQLRPRLSLLIYSYHLLVDWSVTPAPNPLNRWAIFKSHHRQTDRKGAEEKSYHRLPLRFLVCEALDSFAFIWSERQTDGIL